MSNNVVKAKTATDANYLQTIADKADTETLAKIAELIQKPNACNKFQKALNNPLVKALF